MPKNLKYILLVFPLIYLLLGFYFRQVFGDLSLRSNDPDYIHFISGLCISTGQFDQANIDHPGSVLQYLLSIIFRIVYFFRGNSTPYFEDVIINSDLYLAVANLCVTALIAAFLWFSGEQVHKVTGNYLYAILIQSAPLLILVWPEIIGRIYPELLFVIPVFIIQIQLLHDIYNYKESFLRIVVYAIAVAFGMSLKMTFLPFAVVPLILIRGYKGKLKFLLATILSFLLLAIPVALHLHRFWRWMKGIFVHSGSYQSGDSTIVDWNIFAQNLKSLFSAERFFMAVLLLFAILTFVLLVKRKNRTDKQRMLTKISGSLLIVFAGFIFIVSKQYAIRYFIPTLLCFPFLLILIKENIELFFHRKELAVALSVLLFIIVGYRLKQNVPYINIVSEAVGRDIAAREQTRSVIQTLEKDAYKIIVSQDYGCPFHEYAIMYSFCVAGGGWPGYREKLDRIYPNTYQYFTWDNTIKYWGKEFDPHEIASSGKAVYLYLEKNTEELYNRTVTRFFGNTDFKVSQNLIFENSYNGEGILQLTISEKANDEVN